jgi:hypothetical protein
VVQVHPWFFKLVKETCWILTNENAKENEYRLLAGIYYFIDYEASWKTLKSKALKASNNNIISCCYVTEFKG